MKRTYLGILFLTFVLAMSGCGKEENSGTDMSAAILETPPSADDMLGVPLELNGEHFTTVNDLVETKREEAIYATNSTSGEMIETLSKGTQLQRIAFGTIWSAVVYNNQICYIQSNWVQSCPNAKIETLSIADLHVTLEQFLQMAKDSQEEQNNVQDSLSGEDSSEEPSSNFETAEIDTSEDESSEVGNSEEVTGKESTPAASANRGIGSVMPDLAALAALDNTSIPWGYVTTDRNELNQPNGCLYFDRLYGSYNADFYRKDSDMVFLTMDEGYENGLTPQILDTLSEKNVKAVFFVTYDFVTKNPDLVQRMIDEGHVVGNHSYTHPADGVPSVSMEEQYNEFMMTHNYVLEHFNYEMYLFRFPEGTFSVASLSLAQALGYRSVFWSYAYRDWVTSDQPDVATSLQAAVDNVHPGAIYLLHACSSTNATMLGDFIDQVRGLGYEFGYYDYR